MTDDAARETSTQVDTSRGIRVLLDGEDVTGFVADVAFRANDQGLRYHVPLFTIRPDDAASVDAARTFVAIWKERARVPHDPGE